MTAPAAVSTGTPPTSSLLTSPEPPGEQLTATSRLRLPDRGGQAEPVQLRERAPRAVTDHDPNCDH